MANLQCLLDLDTPRKHTSGHLCEGIFRDNNKSECWQHHPMGWDPGMNKKELSIPVHLCLLPGCGRSVPSCLTLLMSRWMVPSSHETHQTCAKCFCGLVCHITGKNNSHPGPGLCQGPGDEHALCISPWNNNDKILRNIDHPIG